MLKVNEELAFRKVEDRLVIVNLQTGFYYSLNETATMIFDSIRQHKDIAETLQALCDVYELPVDIAKHDVEECIDTLVAEHLLIQSGGQKHAG